MGTHPSTPNVCIFRNFWSNMVDHAKSICMMACLPPRFGTFLVARIPGYSRLRHAAFNNRIVVPKPLEEEKEIRIQHQKSEMNRCTEQYIDAWHVSFAGILVWWCTASTNKFLGMIWVSSFLKYCNLPKSKIPEKDLINIMVTPPQF